MAMRTSRLTRSQTLSYREQEAERARQRRRNNQRDAIQIDLTAETEPTFVIDTTIKTEPHHVVLWSDINALYPAVPAFQQPLLQPQGLAYAYFCEPRGRTTERPAPLNRPKVSEPPLIMRLVVSPSPCTPETSVDEVTTQTDELSESMEL